MIAWLHADLAFILKGPEVAFDVLGAAFSLVYGLRVGGGDLTLTTFIWLHLRSEPRLPSPKFVFHRLPRQRPPSRRAQTRERAKVS